MQPKYLILQVMISGCDPGLEKMHKTQTRIPEIQFDNFADHRVSYICSKTITFPPTKSCLILSLQFYEFPFL